MTSVPPELELCRKHAVRLIRRFGHEPVLRHEVPRLGLDPITSCQRRIAEVDGVLAIVGFRGGEVPSGAESGDGLQPWVSWEVAAAFEHGVPVAALLAGEAFAAPREGDPEAAALVSDLRGELMRLGRVFDEESAFKSMVEEILEGWAQRTGRAVPIDADGFRLRRFQAPPLPSRPYPVLLPYTHPGLMAGRERELEDLRHTLATSAGVVGLHAASGTGKSSLLTAGLVPLLRAEGRAVAFERYPTEPGLTERLLADLLEAPRDRPMTGRDARRFADLVLVARHLAGGSPPLLVIDQFEDLLKAGGHEGLAELGPLMAATAQRLPGLEGPLCRWLLAYRREYHGRVTQWLEDVLRQARKDGMEGLETLPHDLSSRRFTDWPLQPLGTVPGGAEDPLEAATRVFLRVIEAPLRLEPFPWRFAAGDAERLARVFAVERLRKAEAPLVPELQVVLAHLLEEASEPDAAVGIIRLPENASELVDRALQRHLFRALDKAFPHSLGDDARWVRARALLVLRQVADARDRPGEELTDEELGDTGRDILDKLSAVDSRLVLCRRRAGVLVYVPAHDRLADLWIQAVDQGAWGKLGVHADLLGLRRFVLLQSRLFAEGDEAGRISEARFQAIEADREVLLWSPQHEAWWRACRRQRQLRRRRRRVGWGVGLLSAVAVVVVAWLFADRRVRHQADLDQVALGEPEAAFAALDRLTRRSGDEESILIHLGRRARPFDIFEHGLGGVDDARRSEALVRIARTAMPILESSPEDPELIAGLVWALDLFVDDPDWTEPASTLRRRALQPLRQRHPPPPPPGPDDPGWVDIPAGRFLMGSGPDEGRDRPNMQDEFPRHEVEISAFRMASHEVTNVQLRRLFPRHEGRDDLPAVNVDWFQAYTYAAWLGGRLPTEAEWEYAARAGCRFSYCRRDGSRASLGEVAWWVGNSVRPETGEPELKPVMQLEPNPFGLWDMYGNVWEWTAGWHGIYPATFEKDPTGPTTESRGYRVGRSGAYIDPQEWVVATGRASASPDSSYRDRGLRPILEMQPDEAQTVETPPPDPQGDS